MPRTLRTSSDARSPASLRRLGLTVLLGLTAVATFTGSAFGATASDVAVDATVAVEAPAPAAEVPAGTPAAETTTPISTSATPAATDSGPAPPPSTVPAASDPAATPAAEVPTAPAAGTTPATVVDAPLVGPDQAPATPAARPDTTAPATATPARPTSDATLPGHPSAPANPVETIAPKVASPAKVTDATAIPTAPDTLPTGKKTNIAAGTPAATPSLNLAGANSPSRSAASLGSPRPPATDAPPSISITGPVTRKSATTSEATAGPAFKLTIASGSMPGGGGDHNFLETLAGYFVPGALNNTGTGMLLLIPVALLLAAWSPPRVRILLSALRFAPGGLRVGYASVGLRPG